MVGTGLETRGGISAVVRSYIEGGLFDRFDVTYIVTHRDGGGLAKALAALRGYGRFCARLVTADAPLVHIHMSRAASFWRKSVVCVLSLLRGRPYILHIHSGAFGKFYDAECGAVAKWYVRALFARAAFVVGLSEHWCAELARIAPGARIRRVPNAVPLPPRIATGSPQAPRILYAGLIAEKKGAFDLVRAFARVASRFPQAQLVCAGTGDMAGIAALAQELKVETRVTFPGWLTPADLAREFSNAKMFALPSYAEGVPMSLLEAMSWALPVVSTPVGGIPEVVQSDRNGLLVPPGDVEALAAALARLLESPSECSRLGAAARATVGETFSITTAMNELAAIYRELGLADPPPARTGQ